jgi:hypothetical protein
MSVIKSRIIRIFDLAGFNTLSAPALALFIHIYHLTHFFDLGCWTLGTEEFQPSLSICWRARVVQPPEDNDREKLGDILVGLGVLTSDQVKDVLSAIRRRRDRSKFGRVAREMGLVREEHILAALAVQMEMFPGIRQLTLSRLLLRLRESAV